jgi:hypothetical protein
MPCSCTAPCVEVEGVDTCTACGLERGVRLYEVRGEAIAQSDRAEPSAEPRRLAAFRRYVGTLALNESVAVDAVAVFELHVLSRGLVFRGLRNAAARLACVVSASAATCSSAVKESVVRADAAECARYGYKRLRRATDRALDRILGSRACFVGVGGFGVHVDAYQRAVLRLGAPPRLVRVCARVDAACFTPAERARYRDGTLAACVLLAVATERGDRDGQRKLGVGVRTAARVRETIEARAASNKVLNRALFAAA